MNVNRDHKGRKELVVGPTKNIIGEPPRKKRAFTGWNDEGGEPIKYCFCIGKECRDSSCPLSGAYKPCDCCGK